MKLPIDIFSDALQCADRNTVEKCQLVCRQWNGFISRHPNSFRQRRQFECLTIGFSNEYHPKSSYCPKKQWIDIVYSSDNEGMQAMAHSIEGICLKPTTTADDEPFHVTIYSNESIPILLKLPNRFTSTTAFHFLNFMKHLNECLIDEIVLAPDVNLPPFFIDIQIQIHCHHFIILGTPSLSQLQQITLFGFNTQEVECPMYAHQVEEAVEVIRSYSPLPFSIKLLLFCSNPVLFNYVIEYFHTRDVASLIAKVDIRLPITPTPEWASWPMVPLFDPTQAITSEDREIVFNRINVQSGKEYKVVVQLMEEEDRVKDVTIELNT